jgi:hypothetical protein
MLAEAIASAVRAEVRVALVVVVWVSAFEAGTADVVASAGDADAGAYRI